MTMKTIVSLGLLLALTSSARAEVVKDWMDSSNYPAQVLAIPIGNNVLSRGHLIRLGAWAICFSNEAVVATYQTMNIGIRHDCQSITTITQIIRVIRALFVQTQFSELRPAIFSQVAPMASVSMRLGKDRQYRVPSASLTSKVPS
jgi:hypothetical protein